MTQPPHYVPRGGRFEEKKPALIMAMKLRFSLDVAGEKPVPVKYQLYGLKRICN
jgi:hypothetical protein